MALSRIARVGTRRAGLALTALLVLALPLGAQQAVPRLPVKQEHDSVTVHLVDADLRAAVEALAPYLDRPVAFGSSVPGAKVTLETPHPVPRTGVRQLLEGLLASQNLMLVGDSAAAVYRVEPTPPPAPVPAAHTGAAPLPAGPVQLFIIRLRHARAADVAATVNALYGRASALGEPGSAGAAAPTLSQQLQANQIPPGTAGAAPASPSSSAAASPSGSGLVPGLGGHAATFTGDVTIVPDPRSNSLLVRATPEDFALVEAAVTALDTRPLEVLIEVIIAEVQRNSSLGFGVDATVPPSRVGQGGSVSATQTGAGLTDFVLQLLHVGHLDIDATLTAAASKGLVKILSRPVVLAANNEPATINVGSQRPFVQLARTLATDNTARDQVVQYKDVGTKLTVLPTISPDGYVGLQVTQEVDNATAEVAFDAPVISTRSVETTLLIQDGHTVALGGLTDRERDVSQGGVPLLSSIPLLGGLFGRTSRESTDTELYLFITPHVIRTDQEADSLTQPLVKRAEKNKP